MSRRYTDILRGRELENQLARYKDWLDTRGTTSKRATGGTPGAPRKRSRVYVKPFDQAEDDLFLGFRGVDSAQTLGTLDGRALASAGQDGFANFAKGQKPAKVYAFAGNGNRTYEQSNITNAWYLKYEGDNYMSPFGKVAPTEREVTGALNAMAFVRSLFTAKDYVRVWYKSEDMIA